MKKLFAPLLFLLSCSFGWGQNSQVQSLGSVTGTTCYSVTVSGYSTATVQVSGGSWSGTIQPNVQNGQAGYSPVQVTPATSTAGQATITANGVYTASVAGYDFFQLCGATVTNVASLTVNVSSAVAKSRQVGGGSGTLSASGSPTANQVALWVSTTALKGVTMSGDGTLGSTGVLAVTGSQFTSTLKFSSLNPNGATLTILAVGGTYATLHDAIAACPAVGCVVIDSVTENLTNNAAGNPVQPFCSGTWVATDPYTCTAGTWKFATVYLGFGKWTSDYEIIYGSSYEHLLGSGVSVGAGGATTGTLLASTAVWDQTGPDPGHPLIRLSPLFTGSNYQFNNTLKNLTLDLSTGSAAGKVGNCVVNDGADENSVVQNVKCYAAKPPTATSATVSVVRTGCPGSCLATATVTNVQGCTGGCVLQNGQQVIVAGTTSVGESFNGTFTVKTATGTPTTSFTYSNGTATNESATGQGTVQVAGAFFEWLGNGAQNSRLEELYLLSGGTGYQDANTNGVLLSSYSTRGVNGITEVMGNGTTPNAGVLVSGGSVDPSIRNVHCEGWTHCMQFVNSSGGVVEQVTVGNTSSGDVINISASVIALSLFDINLNVSPNPSGTQTLLTDNTFTTPFVTPITTAHMGYYLVGSTGSGQHTYKTDLKSFADIDFALSFAEQTAPTLQAVTGIVQDPIYASSVDHRLHGKNSVDSIDAPIVFPATTDAFTNKSYDTGGTGNVFTSNTTNAQTTTYQVVAADFTGRKVIPVSSGTFTITLVASGTQPAAGQYIDIMNYGSGVVTVARSGQNINGAAVNYTINGGSATNPNTVRVLSGGTDYFAMPWGQLFNSGATCGSGLAVAGAGVNTVQCLTKLVFTANGTVSKVNNISTVGNPGVVTTYGNISSTAQTAAITTATLCAAASCGAGQYNVEAYVDSTVTCATPGPAAVGLSLTWTDEIGTKSAIAVPLDVNGGVTLLATMALGNTTNSANGRTTLWSTGANAIQYATSYTACTSGTGTYAIRIVATQVQ